jgi:hypothetical protein
MGIFAVVAGDFSPNGRRVLQFGSSETGAKLQKPANSGLFSRLRGFIFGFGTAWLGREDSNLRMVESKSGYFINDLNEFSDETADSVPRLINRL